MAGAGNNQTQWGNPTAQQQPQGNTYGPNFGSPTGEWSGFDPSTATNVGGRLLSPEQVSARNAAMEGFGDAQIGGNNPQRSTLGPRSLQGHGPQGQGPQPTIQSPIGSNINETAATGINNAISATTGELGYQPQMVGNVGNSATIGYGGTSPMVTPTGQSSTVQAGQVASTDLNAYMNPYTQQVIEANEADILRGANQGLDMLGAQAQAGKAFGGSRHGIAMGEMGRDVVSQLAQSSAGLRQGGFDRATALAQGDIANRMQAGLANQQASQFDIGTGMQADLANQSASQYDATKNFEAYQANQRANQFDISNQMQAALANQSAGLQGSQNRQGAAGQLGSLSNLGFGMGQEVTNNLERQGTQQQALQQALIDAAKGQFQGMTGAPATGLGFLNQALGVTQSGQTQTNTKQPGLFDYLTLGAQVASSDKRMKKNITKMGQLESGLNIYKWDWKEGAEKLGADMNHTIGVIAQEVEKIFPEAVITRDNGTLAVNYGMLR